MQKIQEICVFDFFAGTGYDKKGKKGVNIHGIICGASHIRAVDRFLTIACERKKDNGQANFDIFDNATVNQIDMILANGGVRGLSRFKMNLGPN